MLRVLKVIIHFWTSTLGPLYFDDNLLFHFYSYWLFLYLWTLTLLSKVKKSCILIQIMVIVLVIMSWMFKTAQSARIVTDFWPIVNKTSSHPVYILLVLFSCSVWSKQRVCVYNWRRTRQYQLCWDSPLGNPQPWC